MLRLPATGRSIPVCGLRSSSPHVFDRSLLAISEAAASVASFFLALVARLLVRGGMRR
jgi:hypothetical protein